MSAIDINEFCVDFEFHLKTNTKMTPASVHRTVTAIKRLLGLNVLKDRQTFLSYCLDRLNNGINPYTLNKEISSVKHYLKFADIKWDNLRYFKTTVKNQPSPTLEEIRKFLNVDTTPQFNMYWQLQALCGTRPGEIASLRLRDIDFNRGCMYPAKTKTDDGKPIMIPPRVIRQLQSYVEKLEKPVNFLFVSKMNRKSAKIRPISVAAVEKDCRKRLEIMGCKTPYHPHSFRHAYVTTGFEAGVPAQYVQRSVRHTKLQTTMQYADKSVDFAKKAAEAHPFWQDTSSRDNLVNDWIHYISLGVSSSFNQEKLQQAFVLLREAVNPVIVSLNSNPNCNNERPAGPRALTKGFK